MLKRLIFFAVAISFLNAFAQNDPEISKKDIVKDTKLNVYFVDVGMGDAIFLDIPPKDCMLIDAGSWDKYGVDNLVQFLSDFFNNPKHKSYNKTIDVVVASHQHKDHIWGMLNVLKKFKVKTYIDNGVGCKFEKGNSTTLMDSVENLIVAKKIKHAQITDKMIESKGKDGEYSNKLLDPFDSIDVTALGGTPNPVDKNENDNSIVLKVKCDNVSFLLTGDAEVKEEKVIIERLKKQVNEKALDVDVLKAGHHGSNTANSEELLSLVTPEVSVISVGVAEESPKTKSYRLPKESVVKMLADYTSGVLEENWEVEVFPDKVPKNSKSEKPKLFKSNKEMYLTSSDGTIIIRTDGKKYCVDYVEAME